MLLDKIKRPEYYNKIQQEKNKRYQEQRKKDDKIRSEGYNKQRKFNREAIGLKDKHPIMLRMEWMQPYTYRGWFLVTLYSKYWETPSYTDGYSHSHKIEQEMIDSKYRANKNFDAVKKEFGMMEVNDTGENFKAYFNINIKDFQIW